MKAKDKDKEGKDKEGKGNEGRRACRKGRQTGRKAGK
jgi:hypothetical protein